MVKVVCLGWICTDIYLFSCSRLNIFSSSNKSKRSITNLLELGLLLLFTLHCLGVSQASLSLIDIYSSVGLRVLFGESLVLEILIFFKRQIM